MEFIAGVKGAVGFARQSRHEGNWRILRLWTAVASPSSKIRVDYLGKVGLVSAVTASRVFNSLRGPARCRMSFPMATP